MLFCCLQQFSMVNHDKGLYNRPPQKNAKTELPKQQEFFCFGRNFLCRGVLSIYWANLKTMAQRMVMIANQVVQA